MSAGRDQQNIAQNEFDELGTRDHCGHDVRRRGLAIRKLCDEHQGGVLKRQDEKRERLTLSRRRRGDWNGRRCADHFCVWPRVRAHRSTSVAALYATISSQDSRTIETYRAKALRKRRTTNATNRARRGDVARENAKKFVAKSGPKTVSGDRDGRHSIHSNISTTNTLSWYQRFADYQYWYW